MGLDQFIEKSISPWMKTSGPYSDIVLSTRIRLARNLEDELFPTIADSKRLAELSEKYQEALEGESINGYEKLRYIGMKSLSNIEKSILVEKFLISPYLAKRDHSGVLISENEALSIMLNEEDHFRIQGYAAGFQVQATLDQVLEVDDWLGSFANFAFNEKRGYLTSCPTNTGTGLRASVMLHLPVLHMTQKLKKTFPLMSQLGFTVRGIYGEGTDALGSVFQVSNQLTLGKSEEAIVKELSIIIMQLIEQEREARKTIKNNSLIQLEDRVYRSYGILKSSRIIESVEASARLSDLRLGIDMGIIQDVNEETMSELIFMTQPGFLQYYAKEHLTAKKRDILRAQLIREHLNIKE